MCVCLCGCLPCHRRPLFAKHGQRSSMWEVAEKATLGPETLFKLWHTHTHTHTQCHPHHTFYHKWQDSEYWNNCPSVSILSFRSFPSSISICPVHLTSQPNRQSELIRRKHTNNPVAMNVPNHTGSAWVCMYVHIWARYASRVPQWALRKRWLIIPHITRVPLSLSLSLSLYRVSVWCHDSSRAVLSA